MTRSWPFKPEEGDVLFGAGTNKLRLAWFRTHSFQDGTIGGVLAYVRTLEDYAEVYAVGAFRGYNERVKLRLERMGEDVVPTVQNEGCLDPEPKKPCETTITVFVSDKGQLVPAATIATERIAYVAESEPGIAGGVQYHMISTPTFEQGQIRVLEQVSANDENGREVRRAEVERVYRLQRSGFRPSQESLWGKLVVLPEKSKAENKPAPK